MFIIHFECSPLTAFTLPQLLQISNLIPRIYRLKAKKEEAASRCEKFNMFCLCKNVPFFLDSVESC